MRWKAAIAALALLVGCSRATPVENYTIELASPFGPTVAATQPIYTRPWYVRALRPSWLDDKPLWVKITWFLGPGH